ncbi:MAG TPA: BBP7 family outer membrane beta-barrel protein, partial [Fimbriiglobus sp.]
SGISVELEAKCALGVTLATAELSGATTGAGQTIPNNLLVGPTNAGRYTDQYFAVVPEADVRLGYCLTDRVRITSGYSFLYWSKVQRAADQIDLTVGANRPAYTAQTTDYWVQGWTLGLEFRF